MLKSKREKKRSMLGKTKQKTDPGLEAMSFIM
jgi:hypothetical protein